jgi:hypothetical protein
MGTHLGIQNKFTLFNIVSEHKDGINEGTHK